MSIMLITPRVLAYYIAAVMLLPASASAVLLWAEGGGSEAGPRHAAIKIRSEKKYHIFLCHVGDVYNVNQSLKHFRSSQRNNKSGFARE